MYDPYPTDHSVRHKFAVSEGFVSFMGKVTFRAIKPLKTALIHTLKNITYLIQTLVTISIKVDVLQVADDSIKSVADYLFAVLADVIFAWCSA